MIDRFTNSTYVFCDTMRKAKVLLFLVSQVLHIFGEMTAVRESESNYLRKLICFSDDDDRPLVWTNNLVWKHSSNIHIVWEEEARELSKRTRALSQFFGEMKFICSSPMKDFFLLSLFFYYPRMYNCRESIILELQK